MHQTQFSHDAQAAGSGAGSYSTGPAASRAQRLTIRELGLLLVLFALFIMAGVVGGNRTVGEPHLTEQQIEWLSE